jgi:hypothetical protein
LNLRKVWCLPREKKALMLWRCEGAQGNTSERDKRFLSDAVEEVKVHIEPEEGLVHFQEKKRL